MMLSDTDIMIALAAGAIDVDPLGDNWLQPSGIDVRLSPVHRRRVDGEWKWEDGNIVLAPGNCVLGMTLERVRVSDQYAVGLTGKSGIGRLFVSVHKTAGHVDPGFEGHITLEIKNHFNEEVTLYAGKKVAQLLFYELKSACTTPYGHPSLGSHYQNQDQPEASYLEEVP